ncbi:histidine phosphatase superfamily [Chytriomyces sp. MP71]|nr:histidine phosphatase superfamily [Chytriomyces sp. MP71]
MAIVYHPTGSYPHDHWSLHSQSVDDDHFIGHVSVDSLLYTIYANPTDCTCLRIIVALTDLNDMRSALNRAYTPAEDAGLTFTASSIRMRLQEQLGVIVQILILGNNAHWLDAQGRVNVGHDKEPGFLHAHLLFRGDPTRIYAGTEPLRGPALGVAFPMQANERHSWSSAHLYKFIADMRRCLCGLLVDLESARLRCHKSFYFVRHGETDYNSQGRIQGHIESSLTERGVLQAQAAADLMRNHRLTPSMIYSSSLQRAMRTAEILRSTSNIPITFYDGLREQNAGDLEGQPRQAIDPDVLASLKDGLDKKGRVNGAETFHCFMNRVCYTVGRILSEQNQEENGPPPLLVSHGGVFRALLRLTSQGVFESDNAVLWRFDPPAASAAAEWTLTRVDQDS